MRYSLFVVLVFVEALLPARVWTQQSPAPGAALIQVEGELYLDDRAAGTMSTPFALPDDVVVHASRGRAVIALKRGGLLFLDSGSSVRVVGNGVYNFNRIEVLTGSAVVASGASAPLVACENEIRLSDAGLFRFDVTAARERECRFRVFEGAAAVPLVSVTNALRGGQSMTCNRRCGDMVPTMTFPREQLDEFDRWARQLRERLAK